MKIKLIALGSKMPSWVEDGFKEYQKRLNPEIQLELVEASIAKRTKTGSINKWLKEEAEIINQLLKPQDYLIILDSKGKLHSTESLSERLINWREVGKTIVILIGGPDGIDESIKQKANESISLSKMTFPHPLVRIIIAEQTYRALSIIKGHPYHK